MFVNIVHFPSVKESKDIEFREWFAWSNELFARHNGFLSRKLLKPSQGGNYIAIVEHESYETFMAMHTSPAHTEVNQRMKSLLDGDPTPEFYEVVVG